MRKVFLPDHESLFPLIEKRAPYQPYSHTSRKAARNVQPKIGTQLHMALEHVRSRGAAGCCDFEAVRDLVHVWPSVSNGWRDRRAKLAKAGLIVLSPNTRRSPSGSECDVWIAKEFAT